MCLLLFENRACCSTGTHRKLSLSLLWNQVELTDAIALGTVLCCYVLEIGTRYAEANRAPAWGVVVSAYEIKI
jgi:hypothetical protein